nr:hypothetical protein SHINE37_100014 [Rhizobiaceae bacterium]
MRPFGIAGLDGQQHRFMHRYRRAGRFAVAQGNADKGGERRFDHPAEGHHEFVAGGGQDSLMKLQVGAREALAIGAGRNHAREGGADRLDCLFVLVSCGRCRGGWLDRLAQRQQIGGKADLRPALQPPGQQLSVQHLPIGPVAYACARFLARFHQALAGQHLDGLAHDVAAGAKLDSQFKLPWQGCSRGVLATQNCGANLPGDSRGARLANGNAGKWQITTSIYVGHNGLSGT